MTEFKKLNLQIVFESSPFGTALILYSISFVDDHKVKEMTEKALRFFVEKMGGRGIWRYWTSRNEQGIFRTWLVDFITLIASPERATWSNQVDEIVARTAI